MRARLTALLVVALAAAGLCAEAARAQVPGGNADKVSTTIKRPVYRAGKGYTVFIDYDYSRALVGTDGLEIKVWVETIGRQNLKLIGCDRCGAESPLFSRVEGPWLVEAMPPSETSVWKLVYRFVVGLKPGIEPREYIVNLRFEPPAGGAAEEGDVLVDFPLYVGNNAEGRLAVEEADKQQQPQPLTGTSGGRERAQVILRNNFRDYDVNLQRLSVSTSPDGLITGVTRVSPPGEVSQSDPNTIVFNPALTIAPAQAETVKLELEMAGMSSGNLLSGFDDHARVTFTLTYDDGKQRKISGYRYDRPLRLRPSMTVLLISIAIGVGVGVFIMLVWKLLKYEGDARRKWLAVTSTVIIGLIVSILALQGELNISAFNLRASYDKPLMLFILSLFATVSGTPLLKKFFGLDKTTDDGGAAAPAAPATTTTNTSTGGH